MTNPRGPLVDASLQVRVPASGAPRPAAATKHVALLIETSRSYGRDILRGIHRWTHEYEPWSLFLELRALDSTVPRWLKSWKGDGIIARTASPEMAKTIAASRTSPSSISTRRPTSRSAAMILSRRSPPRGHGGARGGGRRGR